MGNQPLSPGFLRQVRSRYQQQSKSIFCQEISCGFDPAKDSKNNPEIDRLQDKKQLRNQKQKTQSNAFRVNSLQYPYCCIGLLRQKNNQNSLTPSLAFLIQKNLILTTLNPKIKNDSNTKSQCFIFCLPVRNKQLNEFKIDKIFYPFQIEKTKQSENQVVIMQLEEPIGQTYGFFGLDFRGLLSGQLFTVRFHQKINQKEIQLYKKSWSLAKEKVTEKDESRSGSPIFRMQERKFFVIGIEIFQGQLKDALIFDQEKMQKLQESIFQSLNVLDLSKMQITDKILQSLLKEEKQIFGKINSLNLTSNRIQSGSIQELSNGRLNNLKYLSLNGNLIGPKGAKYLAYGQFHNLKALDMWHCMIEPEGAKYLSQGNLISLISLDLRNNNIRCEGLKSLSQSNLYCLENLYLWNNKIRPEGVKSLAIGKLKKLKILYLWYNSIPQDQKEEIRKIFLRSYKENLEIFF